MDKNSREFMPVETRAQTAATVEDQVNQMMVMLAKMDARGEEINARNKEMYEKMKVRMEKMDEKIDDTMKSSKRK